MSNLNLLIQEYCSVLEQEQQLKDRKEHLRAAIAGEMEQQQLARTNSAFGSAQRTSRFKLLPRREPVLRLLNSEDIFPFANFTPARVKELLVPKYGRETLIPLFDIEKTEFLIVRRARHGF